MPRPHGKEAGFALLIVLWSVVLLTLIVTGITAAGRTDTRLAANLRAIATAQQAADGAISEAVFHLLDPARPWPADNRPRTIDVPGATVELRIEDLAGKINPNGASRALLSALLRQVGANQATADTLSANILAWRFPRIRPGASLVPGMGVATQPPGSSALAQQYRAAGLDYEPPGAPFATIDELALVLGMTPDLLTRLRPHLSLLNDTDPAPALADPTVLAALRATGSIPPAATARPPPPPLNVAITATATTPGARRTRTATVHLGRTEKEPAMTVIAWQ